MSELIAERYNASIRAVAMPERIQRLPVSATGFPVPWFVWSDETGVPDFRVIKPQAIEQAVRHKTCWVCGQALGRTFAMMLGPMCCINRTISEPPSHRDCGIFSALACPFMANPRARRREVGLPENVVAPAGDGLKRNPGAMAVWLTRGYRPFKARGGVLFTFDDPTEVLWFASGRAATRDEVMASITSGLPLLEAVATKEGNGAMAALRRMTERAMVYLPA